MSGPIEVRPNLEQPSQATLDIHIRPIANISGTDSKALSATLKAILTPALLLSHHPRTLVQIVGQALCGSDSGSGSGSAGSGWNASLTASLVNASTAALINAGSIPMRGVVCAVSVGRIPSDGTTVLVLDPSESELPRLSGGGCFAFMFSSILSAIPPANMDAPPCSLLWTNYTTATPFDESELGRARSLAEKGARQMWRILKDSIPRMEASPLASGAERKESARGKADAPKEAAKAAEESDVDDEKMEI